MNDSRHISKSQGITFHVFPNEPSARSAWLRALNKCGWEPKDRSAVCSEHFLTTDLYETRSGLRKIRSGAVPVLMQDILDLEVPAALKVCRICLAEGKLYPLKKYKLKQVYEDLTGVTLNEESELPQCVCVECAHRLVNCSTLKIKSVKANTLLNELLNSHSTLTIQNIRSIDRENNQLTSTLTTKHYKSDHCDFYYDCSEETASKPIQEIVVEDLEIKNESEIFLNENDDVKDEFEQNNGQENNVEETNDLTFEEQVAEILKRQESANYKNAVFKCTECFKGFLDEDAYNSHMSRHTKDCGEYQCDICKTYFKHSHALRKHITAHHTQRFSCNQCPYVTTHRQTARLHERWHKGTKYQCPHCPDEFVKFTTYMGHIRIKHPSDFVCQLCGYSFVSEKGIELHKKLKHRLDNDEIPEDGPLCELCNVRFISEEALTQHIRVSARHNTSDKEQRESNKPKKGRKSKEVREREKKARERSDGEEEDKRRLYPSQMRKAEGPIPCEQCGMQLEDSRAYHGHFRRMHPDKNRTNYPSMKSPCMCEVCGRMFQSYALLKDHRWVHTGERPFKCSECSKSFRMKQRLVAHRRVHSAVKASYLCNLCGKHFSTHSNRQRHMIIHTGLRPFRCEMCEKSFKHASEKRAHITYVHLKKPWPKRSRGKRRTDSRQGLPGHPPAPAEMEPQPLWPCDPKMDQINSIMDDKPADIISLACTVTATKPYFYNPEEIHLDVLRANISFWRQQWAEGKTATPIPPRFSNKHLQSRVENLPEVTNKGVNTQKKIQQWLKKQLVFVTYEPSKDDQLKNQLRAKLKGSMLQFERNIRVLKKVVTENKALRDFAPFVKQAQRVLRALYDKAVAEKLATHLLRAYDEINEGNHVVRSLLGKFKSQRPLQQRSSAFGNKRISWSYYDYNYIL
ncbi:THAP domain-containing protein [Phthorimaea operculella]|nr:THAP domain-containing protein [Phthorimaea operculella]